MAQNLFFIFEEVQGICHHGAIERMAGNNPQPQTLRPRVNALADPVDEVERAMRVDRPTADRLETARQPRHGLRITRVAALPALLPCHSAASKARLISASGKACETSLDSGYFCCVRTRKSSALGMIQGS